MEKRFKIVEDKYIITKDENNKEVQYNCNIDKVKRIDCNQTRTDWGSKFTIVIFPEIYPPITVYYGSNEELCRKDFYVLQQILFLPF